MVTVPVMYGQRWLMQKGDRKGARQRDSTLHTWNTNVVEIMFIFTLLASYVVVYIATLHVAFLRAPIMSLYG